MCVCVLFYFFIIFFLQEKTLYGKFKIEIKLTWKIKWKKISTLTLCCQDVVYRQSGQVFIEIKSTSFPKV